MTTTKGERLEEPPSHSAASLLFTKRTHDSGPAGVAAGRTTTSRPSASARKASLSRPSAIVWPLVLPAPWPVSVKMRQRLQESERTPAVSVNRKGHLVRRKRTDMGWALSAFLSEYGRRERKTEAGQYPGARSADSSRTLREPCKVAANLSEWPGMTRESCSAVVRSVGG